MEKIGYKEGLIVRNAGENTVEIDASRMGKIEGDDPHLRFEGKELYIAKRAGGQFQNMAIYLSAYFDWILCTDALKETCLVPLKKEREE